MRSPTCGRNHTPGAGALEPKTSWKTSSTISSARAASSSRKHSVERQQTGSPHIDATCPKPRPPRQPTAGVQTSPSTDHPLANHPAAATGRPPTDQRTPSTAPTTRNGIPSAKPTSDTFIPSSRLATGYRVTTYTAPAESARPNAVLYRRRRAMLEARRSGRVWQVGIARHVNGDRELGRTRLSRSSGAT